MTSILTFIIGFLIGWIVGVTMGCMAVRSERERER